MKPEEAKPEEVHHEEVKPEEAQHEEDKQEEVHQEEIAEPEKPEKKNKLEEAKTGIETQEPAKKPDPSVKILTSEYLKNVDMKTFLMR